MLRQIVPSLSALTLYLALSAEVLAGSPGFRIDDLGHGVYAAIRTDDVGMMVDANALLIVNEHDVVVVDAPEASAEILTALRRITDKPVSALINTHWHDDHVIGNSVWHDAFPDMEIIGHPLLSDYLPTTGLKNRNGMLADGPQFLAHIRAQAARGKNLADQDINEEERRSYASDGRLFDHYMDVVPSASILLPTHIVDNTLILTREKRRIEVRFLGRGHTSADLVVYLPSEGILASGDIVVSPIPLVGADQSHVADWEKTLASLIELKPRLIVPGHGPVLRNLDYPRRMQSLFTSINAQVNSALTDGVMELDEVRKRVDLKSWREQFAGNSRLRGFLFGMYVIGPAVESAWRDAGGSAAPESAGAGSP